jgi:phage-related baseplate assembly protein
VLVIAATCVLTLALAGCGGSSGDSPAKTADVEMTATPRAEVTGTPAADAKVIKVTVGKDSVTPSGTRVSVKLNQPVVFEIDAAEAGELHVHSSPAKAIDFPAGQSQVQISIDKPGLIEAEIENLGKLVVQLEVK